MVSEEIKNMTNEDLATALRDSGVTVGPITETTRLVYERKLARLEQDLPPVAISTESEEDEPEENVSEVIYEEKSSERPYDFPAKVTRSATRGTRRRASPPPDTVDPDEPEASHNHKASRKRGGKSKKTSALEKGISESIPEKSNFQSYPVQNVDRTKLSKGPKSLPKPKLKSNIPRSSQANYANSTIAYPDFNKASRQRRSFGLSDSFHISPESSSEETNMKQVYYEEDPADYQDYVTGYNEKQHSNEIVSDELVYSQQETYIDTPFIDNPSDPEYDHPSTNNYLPVTGYSPQGHDFSQESNSPGSLYDTSRPVTGSEKFGSHIPRWSHGFPLEDQRIRRSNMSASGHFDESKSSDSVPGSKKSDSIWKLDPVEKENIQRGLNEVWTGSPDSDKYEYLPKAFLEKYGRYMNVPGSEGGNSGKKNSQFLDSMIFQSYREQAKGSRSNSATQGKAKKLTSAYPRYTSPLTSKIIGGNRSVIPPQSCIGTPGNSQLNTSLTRRPLRDEVTFTSLRSSQPTSSSAVSNPKKNGMSIMMKLIILVVFGLIVWLIYINFESAATKPLLTTNQ